MVKAVDQDLRHYASEGRNIRATLTDSQEELQQTLERMANCGMALAVPNLELCSLPRI